MTTVLTIIAKMPSLKDLLLFATYLHMHYWMYINAGKEILLYTLYLYSKHVSTVYLCFLYMKRMFRFTCKSLMCTQALLCKL